MSVSSIAPPVPGREKFHDPALTAKGEKRAQVAPQGLRTLWINTGTLCNIACTGCYIESSPRNDALAYISPAEVVGFLDEAAFRDEPLEEVGFTGGEPFMNPGLLAMLADVLGRPRLSALVLTNAMQPMRRYAGGLMQLRARFGADRLTLRVSLDHHDAVLHDLEGARRARLAGAGGLQGAHRRPARLRPGG